LEGKSREAFEEISQQIYEGGYGKVAARDATDERDGGFR
jgi:hypothetical protein